MERKNAWKTYDQTSLDELNAISERYKSYITACKTERECVEGAIALAEENGYVSLGERIRKGGALKAGEKIYSSCMGKSLMLFVIGKQSVEDGLNILGAHIDSPRLDIKQNPLYEDSDIAYLDTHYYGGIKKYQWVALPLALHGVVVQKDGTVIRVTVGEEEDDPVFCISDLLPHLAHEIMNKKASEVIEGEQLDIIVGGMPLADEEKNAAAANVKKLLFDKYGIEEEDFLSAELEVVPAGPARDMGFDRSMILGYGHDDRVCAYAQLEAMFSLTEVPEKTACCILADKEEIGSVGATGMRARYFENAVAELLALEGITTDLALRHALERSSMLSCDVSAGFDPAFPSAFEKKNSAFLGRGVCFNKFTGSRGKGGSNDANAEYIARVRRIMDENAVNFQTAELGRVDVGGGGTIAYICALYGMDVIDSGVAVLSMHAPWEVISKADLYEACKAYGAFIRQ